MANQFDEIASVAAETADLTKDQSFTKPVPREGVALLRLRNYIELGEHDSKNPKNKPSVQCKFVFELLHPDHMHADKDGKHYPDELTIFLPYGKTAASMYRKLFKKMNYTGNKTHFAQMLGDAFLGKLTHNKVGDKTYVNLNTDGEWQIGAPRVEDLMAGTSKEVPVPELHKPTSLFLWENPGMTEDFIKKMWESIYDDRTYEKDGEVKSMNWDQQTIRDSNTWEGSATQSAVDNDLDLSEPAKSEEPVAEYKEPEPQEEEASEPTDPLAALGL